MKPSKNRKSSHFSAFSLIEVLVAVVVLALLMVMMVQITNGILASTRIQNQQMDSVASARRALDIMASDISCAVVGASSTVLVREPSASQDFLGMVCQRPGPSTATDSYRFLAVQYLADIPQGKLYRKHAAVDFADPLLSAAAPSSPAQLPEIPIAEGILGLQVTVHTTDPGDPLKTPSDPASPSWALPNSVDGSTYNGLAIPSGWLALVPAGAAFVTQPARTSRSIEVWIAAIEPQNYALLEATEKLDAAKAVFSDNPPEDWRAEFDNLDVPASAKSALRILNKTFPIP